MVVIVDRGVLPQLSTGIHGYQGMSAQRRCLDFVVAFHDRVHEATLVDLATARHSTGSHDGGRGRMLRVFGVAITAMMLAAGAVSTAEAVDVDGTLAHLCSAEREPGKIPESFAVSSRQNPFIGVWHGHWQDGNSKGMEQTFLIYAHAEKRPFVYAAQGDYPKWGATERCNVMLSASFDANTLNLPTYTSGANVSLTLSADGKKLLGRYVIGSTTIKGEFKLALEAGYRDESALRAAGLTD